MTMLVLFDFDGTLADTAPDLAAAANRQRERRNLAALPYEHLRPVASQGARGLLRVALDMHIDHPEYEDTKQQFLADYEQAIAVHSVLFEGVPKLLTQLKERGIAWGIVTNKPTYLTTPLLSYFDLNNGCASLVCGDTTPTPKPHPAPILLAAQQAGYQPSQCVYVGDDIRDIQAGQAANMPTIAVSYGYSGEHEPIDQWGATFIAHHPDDILASIDAIGTRR